MLSWILRKVLGSKNQREVKRIRPLVEKINQLEQQFQSLTEDQLREKTAQWKKDLANIDDPDELARQLHAILPEAFAMVKNAARRLWDKTILICDQPIVWNMIHFDVQLIGGIVLHEGKIAEMRTGEGKTLVATAPSYLNALTGKGVHVVTVNDYLASLHGGWMGRVYHALGMTTGVIVHEAAFLFDPEYDSQELPDERLTHLRPVTRQEAYRADITYATNNEYVFDSLRDNM